MHFDNFVLTRGGGDLATGVALRLHRSGIKTLITELAQPLAVRRAVAFSEAVYEGSQIVEGVVARLVEAGQLELWKDADAIPVVVDPDAILLSRFRFPVVVDARMLKTHPKPIPVSVPLHIGLGPGFRAGRDCHVVIETHRSHTLGRVFREGTTQSDSGQPEGDPRRVLRAPIGGILESKKQIGEQCDEGEIVAVINETHPVLSPFRGVLRGLIRDGMHVTKGLKIGDVDARNDPRACFLVSDKSLAIGGGVLEAILSVPEARRGLYI